MAIGQRIPITFKTLTMADLSGGSSSEAYTAALDTFAVFKMLKGDRETVAGATSKTDTYRFSEVRVDPDFVPDETMLLEYEGMDLVITRVIVEKDSVPFYYTILAVKNA